MSTVHIAEFTDPGCPWAFSAEPMRRRLDWLFGEQLTWVPVMVGLAETGADYDGKGLTTEIVADASRQIANDHGMPIDWSERERMAGTVPACRAVIAARLHAPEAERPLLRALRVRTFAGGLLDAPATLDGAATDAGLDPDSLTTWAAGDDVTAVLEADMHRARHPHPAALALDHKLAGWEGGRRYTCPSYELATGGAPRDVVVAAGFQPLAAYEVLLANLAPALERRRSTGDVAEVLAWAGEPLATKEVAVICELDVDEARRRLSRTAVGHPVGADGYWTLAA